MPKVPVSAIFLHRALLASLFTAAFFTLPGCSGRTGGDSQATRGDVSVSRAPIGKDLLRQLMDAARDNDVDAVNGLVRELSGRNLSPEIIALYERSALYRALVGGAEHVVEHFARKGTKLPASSAAAMSAVQMFGTKHPRSPVLKTLLRGGRSEVPSARIEALTYAVSSKTLAVLQQLDPRGPELNAKNRDGDCLQHVAARRNVEMLRELIARGADINCRDKHGLTPLVRAVTSEKPDAIAELVKAGANPNENFWEGYPLLTMAAGRQSLETVRALIDAGADVNQLGVYGSTPLSEATRFQQRPAIVELLKARGADSQRAERWQGFDRSMYHAGPGPIRDFLETNPEPRLLTYLLLRVANSGSADTVSILLEHGVDVNARAPNGRTALIAAAGGQRKDVARLLLSKGIDVNAVTSDGETALAQAAAVGDIEMVDILLEHGAATVNTRWGGQTVSAMLESKRYYYEQDHRFGEGRDARKRRFDRVFERVKELERNAGSEEGGVTAAQTPPTRFSDPSSDYSKLRVAIHSGDVPTVRRILEHGVRPEPFTDPTCMEDDILDITSVFERAQPNGCLDPLMLAAGRGSTELVRLLIQHGADARQADLRDGKTALMVAAETSRAGEDLDGMVGELCRAGADPNARDRRGRTALFYAADSARSPAVLQKLLECGADATIIDDSGRGALSVARDRASGDLLKKAAPAHAKGLANSRKELVAAAASGNVAALTEIADTGIPIDLASYWGETGLSAAAAHCKDDAIRYLLSRNADPNAAGHRGRTPLMFAAERCAAATTRLLLEAGGDIGLTDWRGLSAIAYAAGAGHVDTVETMLTLPHRVPAAEAAQHLEYAKLTVSSATGNLAYLQSVAAGRSDLDRVSSKNLTPLMWATGHKQFAAADVLREKGARLDATNAEGETALHHAARDDNAAAIEYLLKHGAPVDAKTKKGQTPLHFASWRGSAAAVEALLAAGSGIDATDSFGGTALLYAIKGRHTALAKELIARGASTNAQFNTGQDVRTLVAESGLAEVLARPTATAGSGSSSTVSKAQSDALLRAARVNDAAAIRRLVESGTPVNTAGPHGELALNEAAESGSADAVKALLDLGADPNKQDGDGKSAVHVAAQANYVPVLKELLARGGSPKSTTERGETPLGLAVSGLYYYKSSWPGRDRLKSIETLLQAGAPAGGTDEQGMTPLMHAAGFNSGWEVPDSDVVSMLKMLLEAGADINARSVEGRTALHHAVVSNNAAAVRALLDLGADRSVKDKSGADAETAAIEAKQSGIIDLFAGGGVRRSPPSEKSLFAAIAQQDHALLDRLLAGGANVKATDSRGASLLLAAIHTGSAQSVDVLLKHGADANWLGRDEGDRYDPLLRTTVSESARVGNREIVESLIRHGATDDNIRRGLLVAIQAGNKEVTESILSLREGLLSDEASFSTALFAAARSQNQDIARLVAGDRTNLDLRETGSGYTLLMAAASVNNVRAIELFLQRGARIDVLSLAPDFIGCGTGRPPSGTALSIAVHNGAIDAVRALLKAGADTAVKGAGGDALVAAAAAASEEGAKLILAAESARTTKGNVPQALREAVRRTSNELVSLLLPLDKESDDSFRSGLIETLLAESGGTDPAATFRIYKQLLDSMQNVNVGGASRKQLPLMSVASNGYRLGDMREEAVRLLIERGADVNAKSGVYGGTALHAAATSGDKVLAKHLLDHGATVDAKDARGRTPLAAACAGSGDSEALAAMLLQRGADVKSVDDSGGTPLHAAASSYNETPRLVKLLVDAGAPINARDKGGRTALDIARKTAKTAFAAALTANGASEGSGHAQEPQTAKRNP